jgi:hypothetical protein
MTARRGGFSRGEFATSLSFQYGPSGIVLATHSLSRSVTKGRNSMHPVKALPHRMTWRRPALTAALAVVGFLTAANTPNGAEKSDDKSEKSWQGTWNNRARGTSGPLRCTVTPKDDKSWDATFEGSFMGRAFSHKVSIDVTKKSERTLLEGSANVNGDMYRWQGSVAGRVLTGRFRSGNGNNGDFRLQQK